MDSPATPPDENRLVEKTSMPGKNVNLHGSAPNKHEVALLVIDVINDFNFP